MRVNRQRKDIVFGLKEWASTEASEKHFSDGSLVNTLANKTEGIELRKIVTSKHIDL